MYTRLGGDMDNTADMDHELDSDSHVSGTTAAAVQEHMLSRRRLQNPEWRFLCLRYKLDTCILFGAQKITRRGCLLFKPHRESRIQ